jgi:type IV fimbrial biogenesis protein FimT
MKRSIRRIWYNVGVMDSFPAGSLRMRSPKGFSVIELLVVVIIMGVLAGMGIPIYVNQMKDHALRQYGNNMEYLVRLGKITAMEQTKNVGICVNSATELIIYNMGTDRGAAICSGTSITSMTIAANHATGYGIGLTGSGAAIDPRGLAIWTGNVCVSNGRKFYRVTIDRTGTRTSEGSGACT